MRHHPAKRALAIALLTLAIVAASCGDSDGDAEGIGVDDETSIEESTTTAEPSDATDDSTEATTTEPPLTTVAADLTASFRGVSETTIKVGVLTIDFERLSALGVVRNTGNIEAMLVAAVEDVNDRGGINGRNLEIVAVSYLPAGTEPDDACVKLTEDSEVFVVLGIFRGDDVLCYSELNDTAVVAFSQLSAERVDKSTAPLLSLLQAVDDSARVWVDAMVEHGAFEGATVGLVGHADVDEERFEQVAAGLSAAGVDFENGFIESNGNDPIATETAIQLILERFRSNGVDTVINTNETLGLYLVSKDLGFEAQFLQTPFVPGSALVAEGIDPDVVDDMLSVAEWLVGTESQPTLADDEAVAACVDMIESRTEETIQFSSETDESTLLSALGACGVTQIFELAASAAGPELTNESFAAAAADLGEISVAGMPFASLGADDPTANDTALVLRFDSAGGQWLTVGDPYDAG